MSIYTITKIKAGCWMAAHFQDEDKRGWFKTKAEAARRVSQWEAWEAEAAEFELTRIAARRARVAAYMIERGRRPAQLKFEF